MKVSLQAFIFLILVITSTSWASKDDGGNKNCAKTEFKSWEELKTSSAVTFTEDENALIVRSFCDLKFHPKFKLSTSKDLKIYSKSLEIKNHAEINASRILFKADELDTSNHSKICADIIILDSDRSKLRAKPCSKAVLLGSAVGKPSVVIDFKVTAPEFAPGEVHFDWSKSFGEWSGVFLDIGLGAEISLTGQSYTHTYEEAGNYTVKVSLETSGGVAVSEATSFELKEEIKIIDFGIWHVINRAGPPAEVHLSVDRYPIVQAPNAIKEFRYDFGDGSKLIIPHKEAPVTGFVVHTFAENKTYDVTLEVEDIHGNVKSATKKIDLNDPSLPVPKYTVSAFKGGAPLTVTFKGEAVDLEDPEATYYWVFPDGEVLYGKEFQEVIKTFTSEGVHWIYLEVRDDLRGSRITHIPIYVGNHGGEQGLAPVAVIDSTARFGEGPLKVEFRGERSFDPDNNGTPLSYHWNFGDWQSGEQNESTSPNGVHTFTRPGTYFVQLTVTDADGNEHKDFISVYVDGNNQDNFEFSVTATGNPREFLLDAGKMFQETDYTNMSIRWNLGDGSFVLYEPVITKQYAQDGTYLVELKVRRVDGDYISYTRNLVVDSLAVQPEVAIISENNLFMQGRSIQFAAEFLQGTPSNKTVYRWSLGDGTVIKGEGDSFKNIVHTYISPGSKTIRLTVTFENGLTASNEYWVNENQFAPTISDLVIYGDLNQPAPVTIGVAPWETTSDLDGNLAEYIYDWGDGAIEKVSSNEGYREHMYHNPGTYNLAVTAIDSLGLSTRFEKQIVIKANEPPILADFNITGQNELPPVEVGVEAWPFVSDIDGHVVNYEYDWGDGQIIQSGEGYMAHTYNSSGTYTIKVRVQDDRGLWSEPLSKQLVVRENQPPILVDFNIIGQNELPPVEVKVEAWPFVSDIDGHVVNYEYDWGDGQIIQSGEGYLVHTYTSSGTYTLKVRVQDDRGLWSEPLSKQLIVRENQPPVLLDFNVAMERNFAPTRVSVEAWPFILDSDGWVQTYEYNWGDGSIEQTPEGYREHAFQYPGQYNVQVRVQDNMGAWSAWIMKSIVIRENLPPIAKISSENSALIVPGTIKISASESLDPEGTALSYNWILPDGTTSNEVELNLTLQEVGEHLVRLEVTDATGLVSSDEDTIIAKPKINNPIIVTKSAEKVPLTMTFSPTKREDAELNYLAFEWFVNGVLVSTEPTFSYDFNEPQDIEVKLVSIDVYGLRHESFHTENIGAPQLYFTLSHENVYAEVDQYVLFHLSHLVTDSPDYQITIKSSDSSALIELVGNKSFKIKSSSTGAPVAINVVASNATESYARSATVEFVSVQEIFNQVVGPTPIEIVYNNEVLMSVSSQVTGNVIAKLGFTSGGKKILKFDSSDDVLRKISINNFNSNLNYRATGVHTSLHSSSGAELDANITEMGIGNFQLCIGGLVPLLKNIKWIVMESLTNETSDIMIDPEFRHQIYFRRELKDQFLGADGKIDENKAIVKHLVKALDLNVFETKIPIFVLSSTEVTRRLPKNPDTDGFVLEGVETIYINHESIAHSQTEHWPFLLLAHEYRHVIQHSSCDLMSALDSYENQSSATITESWADKYALDRLQSLPKGSYNDLHLYSDLRSEEGINTDFKGSLIIDGFKNNEGLEYWHDVYFDMLPFVTEFDYVTRTVYSSGVWKKFPHDFLPLGLDFKNMAIDYLEDVANPVGVNSLNKFGFDIGQASFDPTTVLSLSDIGPYGFGYLKIPKELINQRKLDDGSLWVKLNRSGDSVDVSSLSGVFQRGESSLGFYTKPLELNKDPENVYMKFMVEDLGETLVDGFIAITNNSPQKGEYQISVLELEPDCNRDGVNNDPGFKTDQGGVIGVDAYVKDWFKISTDARVCGVSRIDDVGAIIKDGAVLENAIVGNSCESVTISGGVKISNSDICVSQGSTQQKFGAMIISGYNININENSNLYGDIFISETGYINRSTIFGNKIDLVSSFIYSSNLSGMVSARNALVRDSMIKGSGNGLVPHEKIMIFGGSIENNSSITGIGLVSGYMSNGTFNGSGSFSDEFGNFFVLHLFSGAGILNGGVARGNGWIAGSIVDGGIGNFSGSSYWHSGVHWGARIGANGQASCYSYVRYGELNKSICNKVFWEGKSPDTMDIDLWIEYELWTSN